MKLTKSSAALGGLVFLFATGLQVATAAAVESRCRAESRGNKRSRISVDVKNLAKGSYQATVKSNNGANVATSPLKQTIGDEVEFDFDSNRKDIRAGATAIAANFVRGTTTFVVSNAAGEVASGTCALVAK